MFFTDHKIETLRSATAKATLLISDGTAERLTANALPKKDPLPLARAAATMAAKKTPDLLPYCHPLALDGVSVDFVVEKNAISIAATVKTVGKTGVEMEALTAATVAALTLYDMLKPIDKNMEIRSVYLAEKTGGKSDFAHRIAPDFCAAVIVTSDSTFAGTRQDKSGMIIRERLESLGIRVSHYLVLPDEREKIAKTLFEMVAEKIPLVVTSGGTGLGPRDVTTDATRDVISREIPGVAEAMRGHGTRRTPYAMLSRGLCGLSGETLILNLPGSSRGAAESLDALFPAILHLYPMMAGGGHEPEASAKTRGPEHA